jgi:aspartyl-tRNA(Asn)/glutamyl-tRNA(Gln) amidotransferase subunit A
LTETKLEFYIRCMPSFSLPKNPTIRDIHNLYSQKSATVSEVIEYFFAQISQNDSEIQSVVRINSDFAHNHAHILDQQLSSQTFEELIKTKPLFGIPFALKDNILVQDLPLTAQSKILEGYIASYSSDVYKLLEEAGAVLIAQTNMDEFAFGSSTEYSGFGQITHNPYDLDRVPGGTSGGSAAIVASGMVPFAIGTDTGGSIRQPASFCGVYGIRPTYGTVSRYGIVASASSFDQAGPLANSLEDCKQILSILQQKKPKDQTSTTSITPKNTPKSLGIPKQFFAEGVDEDIKNLLENQIEQLKNHFTITIVDLPTTDLSIAVYYILQTVEAAANLERFDGVRYGKPVPSGEQFFAPRGQYFGPETQKRIMLGTYTSSAGYYDAYYNKACQVREKMRQEFEQVFNQIDVLLMPASPFPAFKIGQNTSDPLAMYLADIMTTSQPIVRSPGLVVPVGTAQRDSKFLPVGLQLVTKEFNEIQAFEVAQMIVQN